MAYCNVRDLFGHFNKRPALQGAMCPHRCCQGKRIHPRDKPLIPNRALLRAMKDDDFVRLLRRIDWTDTGDVRDVLAEAERRERRELAAHRRATSRADKVRRARLDFEIEVEAKFVQAEHACRGDMLSRAGKAARIDPRTLFYGPAARARKYASEDLTEWMDRHGRLSATEWTRTALRAA